MAVRKLHTPGLVSRERTIRGAGAEGGGGGAIVAGRGVGLHLQKNGDRSGATRPEHNRCSNGSSSHAGLVSSIMQPLPLASRSVGAAKHESLHPPASALGSTWIRRFLPSTPDVADGELRPEAALHVPRDLWEGGGGSGAGSQHAGLLLLAPAPKDIKEQDVGMAEGRLEGDSSQEATAMASGNGHYMQKGKSPQKWGNRCETITTAGHDLGKDDIRSLQRRGIPVSSHSRIYEAEGSSRQQQQQQKHEGQYGAAPLSMRGESRVNGTSTPVVTGFGPLRLVMKPPAGDYRKAGRGPTRRAPVVEGGTRMEALVPAAAQPDGYRFANAIVPDRKMVTASQMTGPKFTSFPTIDMSTKDPKLGTGEPGRPSRDVAGGWGVHKEVERDNGRPGMIRTNGATETAVPFEGSNGGEPATRYKPFGEDHFTPRPDYRYRKEDHRSGGERTTASGSRKIGGMFAYSYLPVNPGRNEDGVQGTENRHHSRAAADVDAGARLSSGTGFQNGPDSRKMKEVVGSRKMGERFVPNDLPANPGRDDDCGQVAEIRYDSRAAADAGGRLSSRAGFPKGAENRKMKESVESKKLEERFVPTTYLAANPGRNENSGQATEMAHDSRAIPDAGARPSSAAGFSKGVDGRKMKELVGTGFSSKMYSGVGPSQQQHPSEIPPYAPHQFQGDTAIGKVGQPLPFSPHSSLVGEENSGEETRSSRGKAEPTKSLVNPLFGAPKTYQDGLDGQVGQSEQQAPWTSVFAAFKGHKHPEPPNSTSTAGTLPPDVHARLPDGCVPANHPSGGPKASGNHEESSGGWQRREEANLAASSGEARSRFDNPSSHFASSPWPDNESPNPNDDGGSCPYDSQGTGSGYQSQASRVANRVASDSRGQHMSTYRYDSRNRREGSDAPATCQLDLGGFAASQGEDARGPQMPNDDNQAHGSPRPTRHFTMQSMSGHYTSSSSPPPCPVGYNNGSDLASPVFTRGVVDQQLTRGGQSRTVDFDSDFKGNQLLRRQAGYGNLPAGSYLRRWIGNSNLQKHDNEVVYGDYGDASALFGKDLDTQKAQANARDMYGEGSRRGGSEAGETGLKHGKLRTSGEAMGEAGTSGPSKRNCHLNSRDLASHTEVAGMSVRDQGNGDATGRPSSWLQRWMPTSNGTATKPPENSLIAKSLRSTGIRNFMGIPGDRGMQARKVEPVSGMRIEDGNGSKSSNALKHSSVTQGVNNLHSYTTPSAAAMALVSTATRKIGPLPQQRKGSFNMWPSVHLHAVQAPDAQRSS